MPLSLTRSILAIFVPGGVAVAPWFLLAVGVWPELGKVYGQYNVLVNGVLFGIVVVVGKLFETWGTNIESSWDKERNKEFSIFENWYTYLARCNDPEPVGFRYIGRKVTGLYFELTMIFATASFFLGCTIISVLSEIPVKWPVAISTLILAISAPWHFRNHARDSHKLLCETRKEINERLDLAA